MRIAAAMLACLALAGCSGEPSESDMRKTDQGVAFEDLGAQPR